MVREGPEPRETLQGDQGAPAPTEEKWGGLLGSLSGEGAAGNEPTVPQSSSSQV